MYAVNSYDHQIFAYGLSNVFGLVDVSDARF
jgi:hypothetical protein